MKTNQSKIITLCSVLLAGLLLSFSACTPEMPKPEGAVAVQFSSAQIAVPQTKMMGDTWETNDKIGIYMMQHGDPITAALDRNVAYKAAASGSSTSFMPVDAAQTLFYPPTGTVDFIAYYPYKPTGTGENDVREENGYFCYPVDITNQTNPVAIDMLYSYNANNIARSSTPVELEFYHALSKVTINIAKGVGMDAVDFSGMEVSLVGFYTKGDFYLGNGFSPTLNSRSTITCRSISNGAIYDAIVAPHWTDATARIVCMIGGTPYGFILGDRRFDAGKEYVFDLTLNETQTAEMAANIEARIFPWTDTPREQAEGENLYRTITYNSNGGSFSDGKATKSSKEVFGTGVAVIDDSGLIAPGSNRTFVGWNSQPNGAGTYYEDSFTVTEHFTLYAIWWNRGNGTPENPFQINSDIELAAIPTWGESALMYDIAVYDWVPARGINDRFRGKLNGNNHTVTIHNFGELTYSAYYYVGLFGFIDGGEIHRLAVTAPSTLVVSGYGYYGGIVGCMYNGVIQNCATHTNLSATVARSTSYGGGIVGYAGNSIIKSCYTTGAITVARAGGIAGGVSRSILQDCYTTGNINGSECAGGIAGVQGGSASSVLQNCYSTGAISSISESIIGGIRGDTFISGNNNIFTYVQNNVALNNNITLNNGAHYHYRISNMYDLATFRNNYGSRAMAAVPSKNWESYHAGPDGADCDPKPLESWWKDANNWYVGAIPGTSITATAWDFDNIWYMGGDGYPKLRNTP